mmetsp:Transcript_48654/g.135996  ORF Transcript_48654/g.135996 Transcript_48654/m.135996 type:complete len:202 (-) Transcript_48654:325-930(-)
MEPAVCSQFVSDDATDEIAGRSGQPQNPVAKESAGEVVDATILEEYREEFHRRPWHAAEATLENDRAECWGPEITGECPILDGRACFHPFPPMVGHEKRQHCCKDEATERSDEENNSPAHNTTKIHVRNACSKETKYNPAQTVSDAVHAKRASAHAGLSGRGNHHLNCWCDRCQRKSRQREQPQHARDTGREGKQGRTNAP